MRLPLHNMYHRESLEYLQEIKERYVPEPSDKFLIVNGQRLYVGAMLYRHIPKPSWSGSAYLLVTDIIGTNGVKCVGFWAGDKYRPRFLTDYRIGRRTLELEFSDRKRTWNPFKVLAWK